MAKTGKTYIAFVLDRSGSMDTVKKDTIGGFNQFLKDQQDVEGECIMTLCQFDNILEVLHRNTDIASVDKLTDQTYKPRGGTALLDAIGNTIYDTSDYIRSLSDEEKPEKVIFVIQTDGQENMSSGFDGATVKSLIDLKEENDKWDFIYLGANQDAIATSARFGIKGGKAMTYGGDAEGTAAMFTSVSQSVASYRTSVDVSKLGTDFDFFGEERNKQKV
jgi:hypothetical protein